MKTTRRLVSILLVFLCLTAVGPRAQAVVPPPDGGYPNFNTAEGQNALFSLTTGAANTAAGWRSLFSNAAGSFNTAVGAGTLLASTGNWNTATGVGALLNDTSTGGNTAIGAIALFSNTTGGDNTAIGFNALDQNTIGSGNIALGFSAGSEVTTASDVIAIGRPGANVSNSCFIGSIRGVTTVNNNAIPVLIDSAGQPGTMSSSRRFKEEVKPMNKASEAILALKPVTFHYKTDNTNRAEFGLIAEEVAEINPDLVVRDKNGEIYTVRYDAVNAMLLNEFLKAHRKVEKLEATVAELAADLRQVKTQVQMSTPAMRVAAENR
jgi:Chaperone of endosialidase